jgi:methylglutaconyl-CoA hydratase
MSTRYELRDGAAWITLAAAESRNAMTDALIGSLLADLLRAEADPDVRAIVLTGDGPAFCAGADLKNRGAGVLSESGDEAPLVKILKLLYAGAKPTIAAVNGHAFGGGVGLVAACDIAICVEEARFSFSEVRIGAIPAMISVVCIPKIGAHRAMRLFLTGARFDAREARSYGLVHEVVGASDLEAVVVAELAEIAKGGPVAVAEAKQLVRLVAAASMDEGFAYAQRKIAEIFASDEAAEGMAAFAEKRPAAWLDR